MYRLLDTLSLYLYYELLISSWLKAFLTDRSQYVILNNMKSYATFVLSGVPQGTVLAPILFLIYINDLPTCVQNKVRRCADDVLMYSYINSKDDCISLQKDLTALEQWSHKWQMSFNPTKCEFLRITNKKIPLIHSYYIATSLIKEVTSIKYHISRNIGEHYIWRFAQKTLLAGF